MGLVERRIEIRIMLLLCVDVDGDGRHQAMDRNVTFSDAISNSTSILALIWSVTAGVIVAMIAIAVQRIASVDVRTDRCWWPFVVVRRRLTLDNGGA